MADQIDSVTGGGGDFSLNNFTDTAVTFNVPVGAFDVFFSDTYIGTSSSADGLHTRSLSQIQMVFPNSPATINFKFPTTPEKVPPYTATFTVSWSDPIQEQIDREQAQIDQTAAVAAAAQAQTAAIGAQTAAIRDQTEAINETLVGIAESLATIATNSTTIATKITTIAEEITTIDDNFALTTEYINVLKELADHPTGKGIRTIQPYGYIGNAILYQLYVKQAQAIVDPEAGDNSKTESLAKLNETLNEMFANLDPSRGGFE